MIQLLYIDTLSEGYVILISGLSIVFFGLLTLALFFKFGLPAMLSIYSFMKTGPKKKSKETDACPIVKKEDLTGEITAAIAIAIHKYLDEQHDDENAILTIKKARKMYSPWSSKIYSVYNNKL